METASLLSLIGLGLYINSNNNNNENKKSNNIKKEKNKGGNSIYNSNNSDNIKKKTEKKCKINYINSIIPEESNIINKTYNLNKKFKLNKNEKVFSELLDENVVFTHNNMVPFYGGNLKQNMNIDAYGSKLELHTGNNYKYKPKKNSETQLFKPTKNFTNINGTAIYNNKDRYEMAANNIKNNEKPVESIRVGPGLGLNYNDGPKGGYQQFDARKYQMPKTVDELRTKNNQKESYKGRIIQGKFHIQNRDYSDIEFTKEKQTQFLTDKELMPSKSYINKPTAKPTIVVKNTNRKTSGEIIGAAGNKAISKEQLRPKVKKSTKVTFLSDTNRNLNTTANHKNIETIRKSIRAGGDKKHNNSVKSCNENTSLRNIINAIKKTVMPFFDTSKTTIKQTTEENNNTGTLTGNNKSTVHFTDKAKTTNKQTTEKNDNTGTLTGNNKLSVHYYDKAKTTIKQTTQENDNTGNLTGEQALTKHFEDNAKITNKQTTIHNNNTGNLTGNSAPKHTKVYEDVASTTIKETTLGPAIITNLDPKIRKRGEVIDKAKTTNKETILNESQKINLTGNTLPKNYLTDQAKTTHKETYADNHYFGDANNTSNDGYKVANFEAKETNKETTSNNEYTGIGNQETSNGYISANFEAKETNKETTSNNEYIGTIGGETKTMSYDDIYNATFNEIKEVISEGRLPTGQGPKNAIDSDDIVMQITKNQYDCNRTANFDKLVTKLPSKNMINLTQENENSLVDEIMQQQKDRNDGAVLEQLKENKYNISII